MSLQEILRTGESSGEILVLRDIGLGIHTIFVGPSTPGSFSVGIALHNQWAKYVSHMAHFSRGISIKVQTRSSSSSSSAPTPPQNLQVLSSHIPSLVGRSVDEVAPAIFSWSAALQGHRRHTILTGMDANVELDMAWPRTVGSELVKHPARRRTQGPQDIKTTLATKMEKHDMRAINTFATRKQLLTLGLGRQSHLGKYLVGHADWPPR